MNFAARILFLGGGLDSFAGLLKSIDDDQPPDICTFIDVSDGGRDRPRTVPGEWPGTYRHIREVVIPICEQHGIEFVWIDSTMFPVRNAPSLFEWMSARGQIPVAGPNRICTTVAKVERGEAWLDSRFPDQDVETWVCFEAGEEDRAARDPNAGTRRRKPRPGAARRHNRFPLIEAGLCRCRCEALVRAHGLPVPRKSACTFCPYGSLRDWQTLYRELPDEFAEIAALEARKPPTSNGHKLSIMGYRTKRDAEGNIISVRAPPLPEYVQGRPLNRPKPCKVCGAAERATKATACGYLEPAADAAI